MLGNPIFLSFSSSVIMVGLTQLNHLCQIIQHMDSKHHYMVVQLLASQNNYQQGSDWISTYSQSGHTQCQLHHQHQIQNFYSHNWTLIMNERNNHRLNKSCTIHDLFPTNLYLHHWTCVWTFYSSRKFRNK